MEIKVKSSLSPVALPKYVFTSWFREDFFFFIPRTIFRYQKGIKNKLKMDHPNLHIRIVKYTIRIRIVKIITIVVRKGPRVFRKQQLCITTTAIF